MAGNLIIPRVRVTWGDVNLSAYNGKGGFPKDHPLVYDVEVQLQSQTQSPTASFKWDPTGPGFAEYEFFISSEDYMKTRIYIDFFYPGSKRLRLAFVWAGQSINYGNDMSVTVKLLSELSGIVAAEIRSVTQAYDEKKGATFIDSINRGIKQYALPNAQILRYNEKAKKDLEKAKLISNYGGADQTFGAFLSRTVQENGNTAFANNIEEPNIVVFTPFSWDKDGEVLNGVTDIKPDTSPDPTKRYGYFAGPSIINSLSRESMWQPPQQSNQNNPNKQAQPRDQVTGQYVKRPPALASQIGAESTSGATSSPSGTSNARANPGIQNKDNPDGPKKQIILNDEGSADMSFQTLMIPALVGIKPYDIVYIPSFKGDYIEDWIVDSVNYDQNNGNVSISVQAKRSLGLGTPMNEKAAEKFKGIAEGLGLIGPNATLEAWERYAWTLSPNTTSADTLSNGEYNPELAANFRASGDSFN
jgi:hypothetical protein